MKTGDTVIVKHNGTETPYTATVIETRNVFDVYGPDALLNGRLLRDVLPLVYERWLAERQETVV